jgi:hypothetical protein
MNCCYCKLEVTIKCQEEFIIGGIILTSDLQISVFTNIFTAWNSSVICKTYTGIVIIVQNM